MSEEVQKVFQIQKIYTKDISFESPSSPAIFTQEFQPELDVDLKVDTKAVSEGVYQAAVRVTVTTKVNDAVAFLCEVEQAGIFTIAGFNEDELAYLLGSQCPAALYPYVREVVSDLVVRGGFPQLLLEPVNFDSMFAEHAQRKAESAS